MKKLMIAAVLGAMTLAVSANAQESNQQLNQQIHTDQQQERMDQQQIKQDRAMEQRGEVKDRLGDMHRAIEALERSKAELNAKRSGDEYDGYRARAIQHMDEALHELNEAMKYAETHPQDVHHGDHDHDKH